MPPFKKKDEKYPYIYDYQEELDPFVVIEEEMKITFVPRSSQPRGC